MSRKRPLTRQHYVPQSYLRRFSGGGPNLWVYDKFQRKSYQAAPKNIAHEQFFYDYPVDTRSADDPDVRIDRQQVENGLSVIESGFSDLIHSILSKVRSSGLSHFDIDRLSQYVAIQWMRTREYRDCLVAIAEQSTQAIADDLVRRNFPDAKKEDYPKVTLDPKHRGALHNEHFFNEDAVSTVAAHLGSHFWVVGVPPDGSAFFTSDNPVVRRGNVRVAGIPQIGICDRGVEFAFPISPQYILLILERRHFARYRRYDGQVLELSAEQLTDYNRLQIIKSHRQVYCSQDRFSPLVDDVFFAKPHVFQRDRRRVEVAMIDRGQLKSELVVQVLD